MEKAPIGAVELDNYRSTSSSQVSSFYKAKTRDGEQLRSPLLPTSSSDSSPATQTLAIANISADDSFSIPGNDETWSQKFLGFVKKLGNTGRTLIAVAAALIVGSILKSQDVTDPLTYRIIELPGKTWINGLKLSVLPLIVSNMIVALYQLRNLPNGGKLGARTLAYFLTTTCFAIFTSLVLVNLFLIPNMKQIDIKEVGEDLPEEPASQKDVMGQVEGIVFGLIPGNIVDSAANNNLMGVIFFSIIVGLAIQRREQDSAVLQFFKELGEIMMNIIQVLVLLTPVGVFCLIVPKVATIDLVTIGKYLGLLLGILITGLIIHTFVTLPSLFFTFTRRNPLGYMKNLLPAVLTAFGTSSSAATLPTTTKCAVELNKIDERVANFVLPLGATINMDGTAVKYPVMVIWLAYAQGMTFNASQQVVLALLSVLSSVGSAPIPTAGLAMWIMVLNATGVPVNGLLGLLFGMEWLVDRMETMVNITSDSICTGIMHYTIDLGRADLGSKFDSGAGGISLPNLATEKGEESSRLGLAEGSAQGPTLSSSNRTLSGRTLSSSRNGRARDVYTEDAPVQSGNS